MSSFDRGFVRQLVRLWQTRFRMLLARSRSVCGVFRGRTVYGGEQSWGHASEETLGGVPLSVELQDEVKADVLEQEALFVDPPYHVRSWPTMTGRRKWDEK